MSDKPGRGRDVLPPIQEMRVMALLFIVPGSDFDSAMSQLSSRLSRSYSKSTYRTICRIHLEDVVLEAWRTKLPPSFLKELGEYPDLGGC